MLHPALSWIPALSGCRAPSFRFAAACLVLAAAASAAGDRAPADNRAAQVKAEGQPIADRGDGTYLNPILPGDYPDPSVVRVGYDYYMTHTPGTAVPGLLVWHSRDLVNWRPLGPALTKPVGDVWAPDISFRGGEFIIYFPAMVTDPDGTRRRTNFVITAKDPAGPWSEPIDLRVGGIDPCPIADEAGNRYLYLSGGMMIRLAADGKKTEGQPVKAYAGWPIPADWNIECFCLESPKLFRRGGYYYLVSAQGGTAGPSTSHMAVVARAMSPAGPWTNMPSNPLLRTRHRAERWWSQGHGTILEAADGTWWMMYHAYENDFRSLGRSTLLVPVEWTEDGWPRIPEGADPGGPLRKPAGESVGHGFPLSDDFVSERLGLPWRRWGAAAGPGEFRPGGGVLRVQARGASAGEGAMLTVMALNHSYEAQVEVEVPAGTEAGLLLVYDREFFGGLEMSGYHHETFRTWGTLKIALFAAGTGTAEFRDFRYRGL